MTAVIIPFPQSLQPPLPTIEGNVDYRKMRDELLRIDELLTQSGAEQQFIGLCLERWLAAREFAQDKVPAKAQLNFQLQSRRALRCNILRTHLQEAFWRAMILAARRNIAIPLTPISAILILA